MVSQNSHQQLDVIAKMLITETHSIEHFFQLFELHAENTNTKKRIAIYFDDEHKITYHELNNRVNQLAHYLLDPNNAVHHPETQIGLFFQLSIEYIICQLAVMKAGLSFVALSANTEVERLQEFTKQSEIKLLFSSSSLKNHLFLTSCPTKIFYFDSQQHVLNSYSTENPAKKVLLNQLAYIHNTSGSMGKPKQVLIEYAGLLNCATDLIERLFITEKDKTAAFADISFDAHIAEMMMTLGAGAALYLVPAQTRLNYLSLTHYYNSHSITVSTLTPSVLNALSPEAFPTLRVLLSTGEAVTQRIVSKWCEANHKLLFVNGYGPAEVTIATSIAILQANDPIHVGDAIKGLKIYILEKKALEDRSDPKKVPPNVRGEMFISGTGVGRGYADKRLTAERFRTIADPDNPEKSIRVYQTRDEAKYTIRQDGSYQFYVTGRLDRQLKVHGILICPEEIEALLLCEHVINAQIETQLTPIGRHADFIAYLHVVEPFDLYEYYKKVVKKFPAAIAPSQWVISDKALLSTSSKSALKSSGIEPVRAHSHSKQLPSTKIEVGIAQIWKDVLETSEDTDFSLDDEFDMVGGTSLQIADLVTILRKKYNLKLDPNELLNYPTIGSLARLIERFENENTHVNKPIFLNEKYAVLNHETPLFLIHSLVGDAEKDYRKLIAEWPSQRPIYGITSRAFKNNNDMDNNLDAIANDYIKAMKSIQPRGPYLLGGWSAGGLIAYAMCQNLKNETVYLHMIDTEALATYQHKSRSEYAFYLTKLFEDKLSSMLGIPDTPTPLTDLAALPKAKQIYYFFNELLKALEKAAKEMTEHQLILLPNKKGLISTVKNTLLAILNYGQTNKIDNAILWAATKTQTDCADERLHWHDNEIEFNSVKILDGSHESILLDANSAKTLAAQLERACTQQVEAKKLVQTHFFNRPFVDSKYFIGRENELNDLHKLFHHLGYQQDIAVLCHKKSVGKSRVAEQYFNYNRQEYELKLWFRADNKNVLLEDYEKLARQLHLTIVGNNAESAIRAYLENHKNWLAVYDNAGPVNAIKHYLPKNGGHIIITTQFQEWKEIGLDIGIDYLPTANSLTLLQTISKNEIETHAQHRLITERYQLPLVISQLGAYLNKASLPASIFIKSLQEEINTAINPNEASTFYQNNRSYIVLMHGIIIAINNDIQRDPLLKYSLVILQALAHLHADGGSYTLLKIYLQQIDSSVTSATIELHLDKALEYLSGYFLIQYNSNRCVTWIADDTQEVLKQQHLAFSRELKYIPLLIKALHLANQSCDLMLANLTKLAANVKQTAPQHCAAIYADISEIYANKSNSSLALANVKKMLSVSDRFDDSQLVNYYKRHGDYVQIIVQIEVYVLISFYKYQSAKHIDNLLRDFVARPEEKDIAIKIKLKRINLLLRIIVPNLIKLEMHAESIKEIGEMIGLTQQLLTAQNDTTIKETLNAYLFQAELYSSVVNCQLTRKSPTSETYILPNTCFELLEELKKTSNSKKYLADFHHYTARLKMALAEDNNNSLALYEEARELLIKACNLSFELNDLKEIIPLLNDMAVCCHYLSDNITQSNLIALSVIIFKKYLTNANCYDDIGKTYELLSLLEDAKENTIFYLELAKLYYSAPRHPRAELLKSQLKLNPPLTTEQIEKHTTAHKKAILTKVISLNQQLLEKNIILGDFNDELATISSELSKLKWDESKLEKIVVYDEKSFPPFEQTSPEIKAINPNLPWLQNQLFTGRTAFLAALDNSLQSISEQEVSLVFAIHGMSGSGKSQTAVHFAHQAWLARKYQLIWYLTGVNITDGILALSDAFAIPSNELPAKRISEAKAKLQKEYGGKCLIIIDDAADYESVQSLFQEISGAHFLVTSQSAANWPLKKELLIFERNESLSLIEKVLTTEAEKNASDAEDLAILLGDLPLALVQACAYIKTNCSISDYINLYKTERQSLWTSEEPPKNYPATVAVTFELAYKNVKKSLPIHELEAFLGYCAYLHPDSIPMWLLKTTLDSLPLFNKIIKLLLNFSIIQASEDKISIHKIMQQVLRDKLGNTSIQVINLLIEESMSNDSTIALSKNRELLEHYDAVLEVNPEHIDSLKIFYIAGLTHLRLGNPHKASVLFNTAISVRELTPDNELQYATILDYLGTAYGHIGLPQQKKEVLLKALGIKLKRSLHDKSFPDSHPEFARTYNNLANAYGAENNFLKQIEFLEKALQIRVNHHGETHPEAALVKANLAVAYDDAGQKIKAKQYFEDALANLKSHYGNKHYHIGRLLNNYAHLYGPLEWNVARGHEYVVDIILLGDGVKCQILNSADQQKKLLEEAVAIQTHNFGEKNINVALVQSNLAIVYGNLSLWSKQKTLLTSMVPVYEKFFGNDNAQTVVIKEKLKVVDKIVPKM